MRETTLQIMNRTFDEVEELVCGANLPTDLLVHGTRDGAVVYVTGKGDVMSMITGLGLVGETCPE